MKFRSSTLLLTIALLLLGPIPADVSAQAFSHPGILVSQQNLERVRIAVQDGDPLALKALRVVSADRRASLDYRPKPIVQVECGPSSNPNLGCTEEVEDAQAAYTHALLWFYKQDDRHAMKAIEIMEAWASTLSQGHVNTNAPLQAAWAAQLWSRAAEIIRHASPFWDPLQALAFGDWLQTQYLPDILKVTPCHYGNWHASTIEATANIAIYVDDRELFERALANWRERLPAFVYHTSDGNLPRPAPHCTKPPNNDIVAYWQGQREFDRRMTGLAQETCRDLEHTAYGLAGFINVAETAAIQDIDLYGEGADRLIAAMEFHAGYASSETIPPWLCEGSLTGQLAGTFEIGYAHYAGAGQAMPNTQEWLRRSRPTQGYFHYLWETLTHGILLESDR